MKINLNEKNCYITKNQVKELIDTIPNCYTEEVNTITILNSKIDEKINYLKDLFKILINPEYIKGSKVFIIYISITLFYYITSAVYFSLNTFSNITDIILNSIYNLEDLLFFLFMYTFFISIFIIFQSFRYKTNDTSKGSYSNNTKEITIYLNNIQNDNPNNKKLEFAITLYHELRHSYQYHVGTNNKQHTNNQKLFDYFTSYIEKDANEFSYEFTIKSYLEISKIFKTDKLNTLFFFEYEKINYEQSIKLIELQKKLLNENIEINIFSKLLIKNTKILSNKIFLLKNKIELLAIRESKF